VKFNEDIGGKEFHEFSGYPYTTAGLFLCVSSFYLKP